MTALLSKLIGPGATKIAGRPRTRPALAVSKMRIGHQSSAAILGKPYFSISLSYFLLLMLNYLFAFVSYHLDVALDIDRFFFGKHAAQLGE